MDQSEFFPTSSRTVPTENVQHPKIGPPQLCGRHTEATAPITPLHPVLGQVIHSLCDYRALRVNDEPLPPIPAIHEDGGVDVRIAPYTKISSLSKSCGDSFRQSTSVLTSLDNNLNGPGSSASSLTLSTTESSERQRYASVFTGNLCVTSGSHPQIRSCPECRTL